MKLRVRHELERRRAEESDPTIRARLAEAARSLDRAFIGTIHAFCAQLLRRRPVEAGVDPVFQELAQPDAMRVFARVFRKWIEHRLATPSPVLSRVFARLAWRQDRDNTEPLKLLELAAWNLAEWRDFDAPWQKRPFPRDAQLLALLDKVELTVGLRNRCNRSRDFLYDGLRPLAEFFERVQFARQAGRLDWDVVENDILRLPQDLRWLRPGSGKYAEGVTREAVFASWQDNSNPPSRNSGQSADADLAAHLRDELWEVVGLYQQEKKRAGQLDFMDLLLCARDLLRHDDARAELQSATSASSSTSSRTPTRSRPRSCSSSPPPIPPSAIGAKPSPRPASSTSSAIPSSPSTASAAPTRASSAASAPLCVDGRRRRRGNSPQHPFHHGNSVLRQRRL